MATDGHINSGALKDSLTSLGQSPSGDGLVNSLERVLEAACDLFQASGAGFMMLDDSQMLCAVAATDVPGRLLEELQEQVGHGPCVDALTFDRVTVSADLANDDRWPQLLPDLPDAGVRSVLGLPIRIDGVAVGSLNIYRDQPYGWDESDTNALTSYGRLIEQLLRTALHAREQEELAQQLQHALDHRVVIERAVGAIMGRERIDAVSAYNRLRHRARSLNRKVADLAEDLLADIVRGGPQTSEAD